MLKISTVILAAALLAAGCVPGPQRADSEKAAASDRIREAMREQVTSWNEGRLDGFMKYYWHTDKLSFHGGKRRLRGWDALDSMYAETYSGEQRGVLEFSGIEIDVLSPYAAYVTGDWKVDLPDTVRQGKFTLIWKKTDEGWRIVHDHSS